jgi:hypothetical protein
VVLRFVVSLFALLPALPAQPPLDVLLKKLAENQERAADARKSIVYRQESWVRLMQTNGKLSREEKRQYTVVPTETGTTKKLDKFEGRYLKGGKILTYDAPGFQYKDTDIDGELIEDLTDDLINDAKSRDGFSKELFPLTEKEQARYTFRLDGTRKVGAVEAWRVTFQPNAGGERPWAGEVLIHPQDYQPLLVTTKLAMKIPAAVKVMLGIDIKQLGFSVTYAKVNDELWFPATYGTEFGLKILFGYKRNITMNVTNSDFRKTSAESSIQFETEK